MNKENIKVGQPDQVSSDMAQYPIEIGYNITTSGAFTYEDGFADGYSRAWIECWEHMRNIAQTECLKEETKGGD